MPWNCVQDGCSFLDKHEDNHVISHHMRTVHGLETFVRCNSCSYELHIRRFVDMKNHIKRRHRSEGSCYYNFTYKPCTRGSGHQKTSEEEYKCLPESGEGLKFKLKRQGKMPDNQEKSDEPRRTVMKKQSEEFPVLLPTPKLPEVELLLSPSRSWRLSEADSSINDDDVLNTEEVSSPVPDVLEKKTVVLKPFPEEVHSSTEAPKSTFTVPRRSSPKYSPSLKKKKEDSTSSDVSKKKMTTGEKKTSTEKKASSEKKTTLDKSCQVPETSLSLSQDHFSLHFSTPSGYSLDLSS